MRVLTFPFYRKFSKNVETGSKALFALLVPKNSEIVIAKRNISNLSTKLNQKSTVMSTNTGNINNVTPDNLFNGEQDRFNGMTVDSKRESACTINEFQKKLQDSLVYWKENNKRTIWFRVFLEQSDWIPILVKNGFKYHHAKERFAMLYLYLPKEEHNLPPYAHTMIGVGAVVINDKNQILVVREKHRALSHWKLPGGYVEPGEDLVDAAIREVKEETNISTTFHSILTLRHTHQGMFGCSDIYTVMSLKPLTEDIQKCEREIEKCKWMDVDEYLKNPKVLGFNRVFVEKYLEHVKNNLKIDCEHFVHPVLKKPFTLYSVCGHKNEKPKVETEEEKS